VNGEQQQQKPDWRLPGAEEGADLAALLARREKEVLFLGDEIFEFQRANATNPAVFGWTEPTDMVMLRRIGAFAPLSTGEKQEAERAGQPHEYVAAAEKAFRFKADEEKRPNVRLYRHDSALAYPDEVHKEGLRLTIGGLLEDVRAGSIA